MNRIVRLCLVLGMILAPRATLAQPALAALVWEFQPIVSGAEPLAIMLDSAGHPIVTYQDNANGDLKLVHCGDATCTSGNSIQTVDRLGKVFGDASLALDSSGHPVANGANAAADACQNPSARPLLAKLDVDRASGSPNRYTSAFASGNDSGLVCIENDGATSGGVSINGSAVIAPSDFSGAPALIGRFVALNPASTNKLIATISGLRGQGFSVRVFGADPVAGV